MFVKVEIVCEKHKSFWQRPDSHLSGIGCPKCTSEIMTGNTLDFIIRSKKVHGNKYNYDNSDYTGALIKVEIICLEHGSFWQKPADHCGGQGCPECAEYGFNPNKPAILYYLLDIITGWYKIGITNRTVQERFGSKKMKEIKVLNTWSFDVGKNAYDTEQSLHKIFKDYRIINENFGGGKTEFFSKDILNEDSK